MKAKFLFLLVPLLWSCSLQDKSRSSTEVANELKVASIQGIAATGYAMQLAQWEVIGPSGKRLAQGVTDTSGRLSAVLDTAVLDSFPWLVRVMQGTDTLTALFQRSSTAGKDTLFGLVNPITDLVARHLLGPAAANPVGGFSRPNLDSLDSTGQRSVRAVLGQGVQWADFSSDRNYRPGFQNPPVGYFPSSSDILLHTLQTTADNLGVSCSKLVDSLYAHPGAPALANENFRLELATNMVAFNIPPDSANPKLSAWDSAQGISDSAANTHYNQLWQFNQSNETVPPVPVNGKDPVVTSLLEANNAMQFALNTYSELMLDTALKNYSEASKIVADLMLSVLEGKAPPPDSQVHLISHGLGLTFSMLHPTVWVQDSAATRALAQSVLLNDLLKNPSAANKPDSVRTWVQTILQNPPLPFSTSAMRSDSSSLSAQPDSTKP